MTEVIVSSIGYLKQQITAGAHTLIADEPTEAGGGDAGPDPYSMPSVQDTYVGDLNQGLLRLMRIRRGVTPIDAT